MRCKNYTLRKTIAMSEGKYCYKYPHPSVTTDSVVFGFDGKALHILLIERGIEPYKGSWALPGGFLKMDETVEQGAARELMEETGVEKIYLEQFRVYSAVNRDPRERVITVAFYALVRKSDYRLIAGDDAARASWFGIDELPPLAFDHRQIINDAREHLKDVIVTRPIAFHLLDKYFSMSELQHIYEAINQTQYDRRNFSKKMIASDMLHKVSDPFPMLEDNGVKGCCESVAPEPTQDEPSESCRISMYSFDDEKYREESKRKKRKGRWFW